MKKKELPEHIINGISDVITQYMLELDIKDKNVIYQYSSFCEYVIFRVEFHMKNALKMSTTKDINFLYGLAEKRKSLIKENFDLYGQLKHLIEIGKPDYIIDAIIEGVNYVINEFKLENKKENRDFYCRFGENLCLDIESYMAINKVNEQNKKT